MDDLFKVLRLTERDPRPRASGHEAVDRRSGVRLAPGTVDGQKLANRDLEVDTTDGDRLAVDVDGWAASREIQERCKCESTRSIF